MPDLNKMTLEEVIEYCNERDMFYIRLFVENEGYNNAISILKSNGKLKK